MPDRELFPGATVVSLTDAQTRLELLETYPELKLCLSPRKAKPAVTVSLETMIEHAFG